MGPVVWPAGPVHTGPASLPSRCGRALSIIGPTPRRCGPSSACAWLNASLTSAALAGLRTAASTHTQAHTHYQRQALAQGVQVDSDGYVLVFSPASPSASPAGSHPRTTSNIVSSINNYNTMAAERASMCRPWPSQSTKTTKSWLAVIPGDIYMHACMMAAGGQAGCGVW
jgi:hypothetical protein